MRRTTFAVLTVTAACASHPGLGVQVEGALLQATATYDKWSTALNRIKAENQARNELNRVLEDVVQEQVKAFVAAHPVRHRAADGPPPSPDEIALIHRLQRPSKVGHLLADLSIETVSRGSAVHSRAEVDVVAAARKARERTSGDERAFWTFVLQGSPPRIVVALQKRVEKTQP